MLVRSILRASVSSRSASFASSSTVHADALVYSKFGVAEKVVNVGQTKDERVQNAVNVDILAAPIHPGDISNIAGWTSEKKKFPAVGGSEGVARVSADAGGFLAGDLVLFRRPFPTWRKSATVPADLLMRVPAALSKNVEGAAMLSVAPCVAYRLLNDFEALQEGDVIIQNAANGAVGQAVLALAKQRKVHTINVVRQRPDGGAMVEKLKKDGGYIVVDDEYVRTPNFKRLISDLPAPKLGLDGVGGASATEIARNLAEGGKMVSYGAMSRTAIQIPSSLLLANRISLHGFSLQHWLSHHSAKDQDVMLEQIAASQLSLHTEVHPFSEFQAAIARTRQQRDSKVVLKM